MSRSAMMLPNLAALLALAALSANAQSLAEVARKNRMHKPATPASHVYTNDNLPTSGGLSITGQPAAEAPAGAAPERAAAAPKNPQAEAQAKEERARLEKEWRDRFKKQRDAIALAQREIAALDREIKLRPAGVACSTSNVCNEKAAKEQALQQENQKLEDLKDELRKAELPESWAD